MRMKVYALGKMYRKWGQLLTFKSIYDGIVQIFFLFQILTDDGRKSTYHMS